MEEEKKKEERSAEVKIDFDALRSYRDERGMPILSMVRMYAVSGVSAALSAFGKGFAPIDVLSANFWTIQRFRETILDGWEHYNVTIDGDESVKWKPGKSHERRKSAYKLNSRVAASVNADFIEYSPRLDDELEDGIVSIRVPKAEGE